jgi:hypothetical protein
MDAFVPIFIYAPLVVLTAFFHDNTVLRIINNLSAIAGLLHISWLVRNTFSWLINTRYDFLYLFALQFNYLWMSIVFFSTSFVYQYLVFYKFIIDDDDELQIVIGKIFKSFAIIIGCYILIQTSSIVLYIYIFISCRLTTWNEIRLYENTITVDHQLKDGFDALCNDSIDKFNTREFMTYWMNKTEDAILQGLVQKADQIYSLLANHLDTNHDGKITRDEFQRFAVYHNIINAQPLWQLLSEDDYIYAVRIKELLYKLSFARRRFAFQIYTDYLLIQWVTMYCASILVAGALVFITEIIGYKGAFSIGIDLFKLYIMMVTYMMTFLSSKLQFISLMIGNRPFNIGDLLLYEGQPFIVTRIDPDYIALKGSTSMTISTLVMLSKPIMNMTYSPVIDSVTLTLPHTFSDCYMKIQDLLERYAVSSTELDNKSIRCGWVGIDTSGKLLNCSWTYSVNIHDRKRYLWMKTRVLNHIIINLGDELAQKTFALKAAQGGAYNDKIEYTMQ